jgi:hypothetical protein
MRPADAIKSILKQQGRSQRSLTLGLTRLKSKTMKVETPCQTAEQLGHTVQLVPASDKPAIRIEG